jgi:transposase InsO family protein
MPTGNRPPVEMRLRVLSAIDYAQGDSIQARIRDVAKRTFVDDLTKSEFKFTPRTISTWLYRFKSSGITSLETKPRSDKNTYRKVQPNELAEAIKDILPRLKANKTGRSVKMSVYRLLLKEGFFTRHQLSQTHFYRLLREHDMLNTEATKKLRQSFAMKYANEMWQADTMYGPTIKQPDGTWKKTFLIAFLDDASRVITHAEFFYQDNTENMIDAFRTALFKRGKPERLYFDNGSNYRSKEILQACLRLDILLSHAPIRDGAAKGKIERFFRGFRDRFLTLHHDFSSLSELNEQTQRWIEEEYNTQYHSGIQMIPIDRFNIDHRRIQFLTDDEFSEEIFFIEQDRKVGKTNLIHIDNKKFECPVDLRGKVVQVRFDRVHRNRFIIYFKNQRMGEATLVNLHLNAKLRQDMEIHHD